MKFEVKKVFENNSKFKRQKVVKICFFTWSKLKTYFGHVQKNFRWSKIVLYLNDYSIAIEAVNYPKS